MATLTHRDNDPRVAREYDAGVLRAPVAQVVAGVAEPPGPEELKTMVDEDLNLLGYSAPVRIRLAS